MSPVMPLVTSLNTVPVPFTLKALLAPTTSFEPLEVVVVVDVVPVPVVAPVPEEEVEVGVAVGFGVVVDLVVAVGDLVGAEAVVTPGVAEGCEDSPKSATATLPVEALGSCDPELFAVSLFVGDPPMTAVRSAGDPPRKTRNATITSAPTPTPMNSFLIEYTVELIMLFVNFFNSWSQTFNATSRLMTSSGFW